MKPHVPFGQRRLPQVSEAQAQADQLDAQLDSLGDSAEAQAETVFSLELAAAFAVRGAVEAQSELTPDAALITLRAGLATKRDRARAERRRAGLALAGMAAMIAAIVGGFTASGRLGQPSARTISEAQASLIVLDQQVHALQSVSQSNDPVQIQTDIHQAQAAARAARATAAALPDPPARQLALAVANQRISDLQAVVTAAEARIAVLGGLTGTTTTASPSTSTSTTVPEPPSTTVPTTTKTTIRPRPTPSTSTTSTSTTSTTLPQKATAGTIVTTTTTVPDTKGS